MGTDSFTGTAAHKFVRESQELDTGREEVIHVHIR